MQRSLQATRRSKLLVQLTSILPGLFEEHYSSRAPCKQVSVNVIITTTEFARTLSKTVHHLMRLRRARNISLQYFRRSPRSGQYIIHNL
jgi:hypothetical protein